MARGSKDFVVSSFRISSFGMNPVSGGSPPRDVSVSRVIVVIAGEADQVVPMSVMVFVVMVFSEMNMADVMIM